MAQVTSSGKKVINLLEWIGRNPKKIKKIRTNWEDRREQYVTSVLDRVTAALNKVHKP